ncbi:BBE domain-containing protein [Amnibacterium kyonggiense]
MGDAAYANYCDAAITDPSAYFGGNTDRLRAIARAADPDGLLQQPHWV